MKLPDEHGQKGDLRQLIGISVEFEISQLLGKTRRFHATFSSGPCL